mmetsp:Transcript_31994/g.51669  ORF Transcript_31994/g.51669 Transcript_31994/m.51669 type:complete len:489 (+) Transcript_31994:380-1846(+)
MNQEYLLFFYLQTVIGPVTPVFLFISSAPNSVFRQLVGLGWVAMCRASKPISTTTNACINEFGHNACHHALFFTHQSSLPEPDSNAPSMGIPGRQISDNEEYFFPTVPRPPKVLLPTSTTSGAFARLLSPPPLIVPLSGNPSTAFSTSAQRSSNCMARWIRLLEDSTTAAAERKEEGGTIPGRVGVTRGAMGKSSEGKSGSWRGSIWMSERMGVGKLVTMVGEMFEGEREEGVEGAETDKDRCWGVSEADTNSWEEEEVGSWDMEGRAMSTLGMRWGEASSWPGRGAEEGDSEVGRWMEERRLEPVVLRMGVRVWMMEARPCWVGLVGRMEALLLAAEEGGCVRGGGWWCCWGLCCKVSDSAIQSASVTSCTASASSSSFPSSSDSTWLWKSVSSRLESRSDEDEPDDPCPCLCLWPPSSSLSWSTLCGGGASLTIFPGRASAPAMRLFHRMVASSSTPPLPSLSVPSVSCPDPSLPSSSPPCSPLRR